ncbi:fungal-specific transcription factor domain-containing protein [Schizophyllum amplum]|uniref:Fungal-specific transcription factor domain-containing protein n=1 Tax=Schizophyllum amplum TaxID=97359 RepID=A0A550CHK4_9AGAR|nr:fungal-specific transcription factor domain-containing protein [Auriculariopsis ampla]
MPPVAKQKRSAADRAKGASRAKSGCYTCRIRRKKCDEERDEHDHCRTCTRLRLQCLGFGTKRPEYLRDNDKVNEMRDKIKLHLATNGMIKGHAGTSSRAMDDRPVCVLHEGADSECTPSPESSPQSPAYSLEDDFPNGEYTLGLHRHAVSSVRDDRYYPTCLIGSTSYPKRSTDPDPSTSAFEDPHRPPSDSSALMASSPVSVELPQTFGPEALPQYVSSFGPMYNSWPDDDFAGILGTLDMQAGATMDAYLCAPQMFIPTIPANGVDETLGKYYRRLAKAQFLLADESKFGDILFGPMQGSQLLQKAVGLLSMVDDFRTREPHRRALKIEDVKYQHDDLWRAAINPDGALLPFTTPEVATAAIITVSAHLFDGGRGSWFQWLHIACQWALSILHASQYEPAQALIVCTERNRFLIKTAMWFDVLASVTTQQEPIFASTFREMFDPQSGLCEEGEQEPSIDARISMLDVMGCDNSVVWALSETSCLAAWKANEERNGCLSTKDLVSRAAHIEAALARTPPALDASSSNPVSHDRRLTADIFHAAARLYLHTVLSGAHPRVPDIHHAVRATVDALSRVRSVSPESGAKIVRNTVFAAFIAGALAAEKEVRAEVHGILELGARGAGNCRAVNDLLQSIWQRATENSPSSAVPWREQLAKHEMLLV